MALRNHALLSYMNWTLFAHEDKFCPRRCPITAYLVRIVALAPFPSNRQVAWYFGIGIATLELLHGGHDSVACTLYKTRSLSRNYVFDSQSSTSQLLNLFRWLRIFQVRSCNIEIWVFFSIDSYSWKCRKPFIRSIFFDHQTKLQS